MLGASQMRDPGWNCPHIPRHIHENASVEDYHHITTAMSPLTERPAWRALHAHHARVRDLHLRQLFADDPQRAEHLSTDAVGLHFDYSKNRITSDSVPLLLQLAQDCGLAERREAMF